MIESNVFLTKKKKISVSLMPIAFSYQEDNSSYSTFLPLGTTHELYEMQDQSWYGFILKDYNSNPFLPPFLLLQVPIYIHLSLELNSYSSKTHGGICHRVSWKGEKKLSTLISQTRHVKFSWLLINICMFLVSVLQAATMYFVCRKCQLMTMF